MYIPGEQDGPFITRDGRIYRRVYDSSDPVKEDNRTAVDRMYETSRERARRFREFCDDNRSFSQAEAEQAWVSVFLAPYPGGLDMTSKVGWNRESLENLLKLSRTAHDILPWPESKVTGNIPFDVAHPTHDSAVLVHRFQNSLASNALTMELFVDGRAKIHIPLSYIPRNAFLNHLVSTSTAESIIEAIDQDREGSNFLRFFDGGQLLVVLASLMTLYGRWIGTQPLFDRLEYACNLAGLWRHVVVLDADAWGEFIAAFGLPILSGNARIGQDSGRGYFTDWCSEDIKRVPWLMVARDVFLALGVPMDIFAQSVHPAFMRASTASSPSRT